MPSDMIPASNGPPATRRDDGDMFLVLIDRAARDPMFDLVKFEALMAARDREIARIAKNAHIRAMNAAQRAMGAVSKDGTNTHLRVKYSTLDAMLKVILPAIEPHGLTVRFGTAPAETPGWRCVTCIVSHVDGHEEVTAMEGPPQSGVGVRGGQTQMNELQAAAGSTTTYLKRYALGMAFLLVLEDEQDDDGEATRGGNRPSPPSHPPRQINPTDNGRWMGGQQPPAQPAQGAPRGGNGAAQPNDPTAWLRRLELLLSGCRTAADVDALMAREAIANWRATATPTVRAQIDAMESAALERVRPAPQPAPPAAAPPDATPAGTPAMLALLAEIGRADAATLEAMPTDAAFNSAIMALSFTEQEQVDAAFKERAAELGQGASQ